MRAAGAARTPSGERALTRALPGSISAKPDPAEEGTYDLSLVALPKRALKMKVVDGVARAVGEVNGQPAYVKKVYVYAEEGWVRPTVKWVNLYGQSIETGEELVETMLP